LLVGQQVFDETTNGTAEPLNRERLVFLCRFQCQLVRMYIYGTARQTK
jgi:hypothetical protein